MVLKIRPVALIFLFAILVPGIVNGNPLLDEIAEGEGTSDDIAAEKGFASGYDVPLAYGAYGKPSVPLTEMTIKDVQDFQDLIIENQIKAGILPKDASGAVGKYQITKTTLQGLLNKPELELTVDSPFNAETQEKLAQALLEERGYVNWLNGKDPNPDNSLDANAEFQDKLAWEWASIADPLTGKGKYPTQPNARTSTEEIKDAMTQTKLVISDTTIAPIDPTAPVDSGDQYEAYRIDEAFIYYSQGIILASSGKHDEAIQAFYEAIRLRPDYAMAQSLLAEAWIQKGDDLKKEGKYDEAMDAYDKSMEYILKKYDKKDETVLSYFESVDAPKTKPLASLAALGLDAPLISPISGTLGFSVPNKDGTDVPETSGATFFDQANDVWYIDAFEWHYGDRSAYDKPAAPRRFVSGELNTYGYNWVSLPYSRTGMTYDQDYFNWCAETLAALGQSAPSAGYGLLIDESQSDGGW